MNSPAPDSADLVREIRGILDDIQDPCSVSMSMPMGLDEMGLVESVDVSPPGRVEITLRLTSPFCEFVPFMKGEALRRVRELEGVTEVVVLHDDGFNWDSDLIAPEAQERRQQRLDAMQSMMEEHMTNGRMVGNPRRIRVP